MNMKHILIHLTLFVFAIYKLEAQQNIQNVLDQIKSPDTKDEFAYFADKPSQVSNSHFGAALNYLNQLKTLHITLPTQLVNNKSLPDTIIVGIAPFDTLNITSSFTHKGPIIIVRNGVLNIKDAIFTNVGDLYVLQNGQVNCDSSQLNFPQSYFYQRGLILVNHAKVSIHNSKLSYGGYTHICNVSDSAQLFFENVTQPDFMTTGLSKYGQISINGTNQAGEFIIQDQVKLSLKNASNALLWHHFPDTSVITWSFGTKDTVYNYQFNKFQKGIKGIEYQIFADSVYKIMWGMMPSAGSKIKISNSNIRTVGLWFDHSQDTTYVSGITNNTYYSSYTLPLKDRSLTLSNCNVQTWSLYAFKKSRINVSGCIVGEIGTYNSSSLVGSSFWNDGSGGYLYASDSALNYSVFTTASSAVRSEKNSIFVFGYSTIGSFGYAAALDQSLLVVIQSSIPSDPTVFGAAAVVYNYLNPLSLPYVDTMVEVSGSAWIHRGPTSVWMHFKNKQLFYQAPNDTAWNAIAPADTIPVSNQTIANWNTHLLTPGLYNLRLRITDNWGNKTDATRQVNLLSGLLTAVQSTENPFRFNIYPVPANDVLNIQFIDKKDETILLKIYDLNGKELMAQEYKFTLGLQGIQFNISAFQSGTYLLKLESNRGVAYSKFVINR